MEMPDKRDFHNEEELAPMKSVGAPPPAQGNTGHGNGDENGNGATRVHLQRTALPPQNAQLLWVVIRNRTIDFNQYKKFIDGVMCCTTDLPTSPDTKEGRLDLRLPFPSVRAYNLLKLATELYLMQECGVFNFCDQNHQQAKTDFRERFDEQAESNRLGRDLTPEMICDMKDRYLVELKNEIAGTPDTWVLPYFELIRQKLQDIPLKYVPSGTDKQTNCYGILRSRLSDPCLLELIWSYWHEEGMLVQTMNAITRRFQNMRSAAPLDPLANLEIDPLRPLNNLMWGHIQDEQHRLTITRRAYEYDHHYGLRIVGKAVPELRPADSRSKFLEAFHQLLYTTTLFFQQRDDTTVIADGFPVLNALREVHLILAQGAHNQFGDLPWTSRVEMLMEMWLLARPEMREFLRGRIMVPYPEPWMGAVDSMKSLQKWNDTSIREFRDLGVFGEQLLLSIRYDNWSVYNDANLAASWADYWRQEIQRYIHSYRAVTGVDLSQDPVNSSMPSVLLQRRLASQATPAR
jgi:hypothetical protein